MTAGLGSLCNDTIDTAGFEKFRFGDSRCTAQNENPYRFDFLNDFPIRQAEMEAYYFGFGFLKHGQMFGINHTG